MITFFVCYAIFVGMQKPAAAAENGQQAEEENLSLNARAAVLMDADSGRILYGKEADSVYPIASTTKIMTAVLAVESGKLDYEVTTNESILKSYGSGIYISVNEKT